jgi:hypothetical protein
VLLRRSCEFEINLTTTTTTITTTTTTITSSTTATNITTTIAAATSTWIVVVIVVVVVVVVVFLVFYFFTLVYPRIRLKPIFVVAFKSVFYVSIYVWFVLKCKLWKSATNIVELTTFSI